jgi:hypothetical protein
MEQTLTETGTTILQVWIFKDFIYMIIIVVIVIDGDLHCDSDCCNIGMTMVVMVIIMVILVHGDVMAM